MKNENKKGKKKEISWLLPLRKPNPSEVRKMFGIALQRLVMVCLSNHVYKLKNVARKQKNGSATGLDLVNALSDLYLLWWDEQFCNVVEKLTIMMDINVRFKDDVNLVTDLIPRDLKYENGKFEKKENISNEKTYQMKNIQLEF